MNGKKAKFIRRQAEKIQVQWINSLLTDDQQITEETLDQALPEQEYYYKGFTLYLSFMNHKWVEKRLKKNIKTIENPIEKVKKLRGVEYEWNDKQDIYEEGTKDSGIIAQDVQEVLPQLVKEREDGHLGVRHDRLVGLLIESVKEQQKQIEELKSEIQELKDGSSK